jgi:hypothetical protein
MVSASSASWSLIRCMRASSLSRSRLSSGAAVPSPRTTVRPFFFPGLAAVQKAYHTGQCGKHEDCAQRAPTPEFLVLMFPLVSLGGKAGNTLAGRSGRGPMTASLATPYFSGLRRALSRSAMPLPLCLIGLVPGPWSCFQLSQCLSNPSKVGGPPTNQVGFCVFCAWSGGWVG